VIGYIKEDTTLFYIHSSARQPKSEVGHFNSSAFVKILLFSGKKNKHVFTQLAYVIQRR
jgi:hypothetical protein